MAWIISSSIKMSNVNIIFFHGLDSSNQTNKFQCIQHQTKECLTVDYIGLGVDDVGDLYNDMILDSIYRYDKTILVGHSFGAYFANMFAVKYSMPALLISPCMRPNVYAVERMPEVAQYNWLWETNYTNKITIMIENDDELFDVETDVALLKNAPAEYLTLHRFDGGNHRICREDVINKILNVMVDDLTKPKTY